MSEFPHDLVPDGAIFAPHHLYLGALLLLGVCWVVSDNYADQEAWVVATATLAALFGFALTWRYYPTVGAALVLAGLSAALLAVLTRSYWTGYGWAGHRGLALVGVLVALDDALEHALGVPTPLDQLWGRWLLPAVRGLKAAV